MLAMIDRRRQPGVRALQVTVTLVVIVVWAIVILRVSSCIGDAECTFAPRAIENAILAFVGGPLALLAVWVVPVLEQRIRPGWTAAGWMTIGSIGAAASIIGVLLAGGGGVVAIVLLTAGPALLLAGVTGLMASAPMEEGEPV